MDHDWKLIAEHSVKNRAYGDRPGDVRTMWACKICGTSAYEIEDQDNPRAKWQNWMNEHNPCGRIVAKTIMNG